VTVSGYSVWFWFLGLNSLAESCPAYTFPFAKQEAGGQVSAFCRAQPSATLAVYAALLSRELLIVLCFFVFTVTSSAFISGLSIYFVMRAQPRRKKAISVRSDSYCAGWPWQWQCFSLTQTGRTRQGHTGILCSICFPSLTWPSSRCEA